MWLLGAPDPEMEAIEGLLRGLGETVVHAAAAGRRVHAGVAYRADAPALDCDELIAVECGGQWSANRLIDHHRPGDPGYGQPPERFFAASSIGQVVHLLGELRLLPEGWTMPPEYVLIAAADHCLAAAYQGTCPGVDPGALMTYRVRQRAAFQRRPEAAVMAEIEAATAALRAAPRDEDGVAVLASPVAECPEAAARLGLAFRVTLDERGQRKEVLQAASPDQVRAFMARHEAAGRSPYGDPARGFAGCIL